MANKQYISIIRLFEHCGISTGDDFNLLRVKKQLQAEFTIAKNGFIEVDGYTYSRHDVLEEIEQPDFLNRLTFHKAIWKSRQLLQLLENNSIDLTTIHIEFISFWNNKEFDQFFSPYFAGPFNYLSRTLLTEMRLKEMGDLLGYEGFLLPVEREEAFRPLRIFLDENIRLLRNVNGDNYKMMRPKIAHWIDQDWYVLFNHLPQEFYDEKNDITSRLVNIGVAIQKTHRRDCRKMSEQLISLQDTPESLRSIIVSNHAVYTSSRVKGIGFRGGFGIVWVFILLIRAITSNGCNDNSNNSYKFTPPDFSVKYELPDTLFKIMQDTSYRRMFDTLSNRIVPLGNK